MSSEIDIPVGKTALYTCAERALESKNKDRVFTDEKAEILAGEEGHRLLDQFHKTNKGKRADPIHFSLVQRTQFFDQIFQHVLKNEYTQIVIVAAGMDTRFFRLASEEQKSFQVWELDFPQVMNYKHNRLGNIQLDENYNLVGVDFRLDNWEIPLLERGYRKDVKSLWIIEGLFMYLIDDVIEKLIQKINQLTDFNSIITGDWMNRSYMNSCITSKFRGVFDELGSPFINSRNPTELKELFNSKGNFKIQIHALGDQLNYFTDRFPINQRKVALKYSIDNIDNDHVPRHYLFFGEKQGNDESNLISSFIDKYSSNDKSVNNDELVCESLALGESLEKTCILSAVCKFFSDCLDTSIESDKIDENSSVFDYGIDSLIIVQLRQSVSVQFSLPPSHLNGLWQCDSFKEFVDLIHSIATK